MTSNSDILTECDKAFLTSLLDILKKHLPREIRSYNTIYNYWYHYDKINGNRANLRSDRWNFQFYRHRYGKAENCTLISISGLKVRFKEKELLFFLHPSPTSERYIHLAKPFAKRISKILKSTFVLDQYQIVNRFHYVRPPI